MGTARDRRTLVKWRNAVIAGFALGGITVATWGPRLPTLRADLGVTNGIIGAVLAGVTVGALAGLGCSTAILSWLGARGGIRGSLWVVALGVAIIGLGAGVAHALAMTAVGFVLVGFGIGAVDVMLNVEGAAVEREAGRTLMPLMHSAWSAGVVVGAGIGAGCAFLNISVPWQFVGEAALIAVSAPILVAGIPDATLPVPTHDQHSLGERIRDWARGWADWRLLLIGLVMLGVELGEGASNSWLTLAVRDDHHQTDAAAALFFVVFAVAETTARVLGGPFVDRKGRTTTVRRHHCSWGRRRDPVYRRVAAVAVPRRHRLVGGGRVHGVPARHECRRGERPKPCRRGSASSPPSATWRTSPARPSWGGFHNPSGYSTHYGWSLSSWPWRSPSAAC